MAKKAWALALAILILLGMMSLVSCGEDSALASRVDTMLAGGDKGREAQRLIMDDAQNVYPALTRWLGGDDERQRERALSALIQLGEDARQYLLQNFSTMSAQSRPGAVTVLAAPADNEAILRLISLMRFEDVRGDAVAAIVAMGEPAARYLAAQLHSAHYDEEISEVLVAFGSVAVPLVVPALASPLSEKAQRAIRILSAIGEPAIPGMVSGMLEGGSTAEAFSLAGDTLSLYPEAAVAAILDAVCGGAGTPRDAADLLLALSPDCRTLIYSYEPQGGDAEVRRQVLRQVTEGLTAGAVLDLALADSSEPLWQGAALGLLDGDSLADSVMAEILSRMGQSADTDALLEQAAQRFLPEGRSRELVRDICAGDGAALRALAAAQDAQGLAWLGVHLSMAADNDTVYARCADALTGGENRLALLTAFASGTDDRLPGLVMQRLADADDAVRLEALTALSQALAGEDPSGSFQYAGFDYAGYVQGWLQCLQSADEQVRNQAVTALGRVPTEAANHAFFASLFDGAPSQYLLEVLAGHYSGDDALTPVLLYSPQQAASQQIKSVALTVTGSIAGVAADDAPDLEQAASRALAALGATVTDSAGQADLTLKISFDGRALSKFYAGKSKTSYTGAQFTVTLQAAGSAGEQTLSAAFTLSPPDTVESTAKEYQPEPTDAPLTECYEHALIDGLYQLLGKETLFALYGDYSDCVLPLAQPLWQTDAVS